MSPDDNRLIQAVVDGARILNRSTNPAGDDLA
jgi:hypothetical protein